MEGMLSITHLQDVTTVKLISWLSSTKFKNKFEILYKLRVETGFKNYVIDVKGIYQIVKRTTKNLTGAKTAF